MRLVAYTDSVEVAGAERALATLLEWLDPSIDVTVLGISTPVVEAIAAGRGAETRVVHPVGNKWDLRPILGHLRAVRSLRPDVFHANLRTPYSGQYGLAAALLTRGARVVAVEHAPLPFTSVAQRRLRRRLLRRVDAHVAVGVDAARRVEGELGLARGKVRTIHNGVADEQTASVPRLAEGPTIGSFGRLVPEKGIDDLLRAMTRLQTATAAIVGDGPERESLERLALELGVADRVRFVGWTDARRYYGAVDVVAIPSRFESFSIVAVEAMLAERPVVAFDVGGLSEVVVDGETGLLVPAGDEVALASALQRLLDDPGLRASLGREGRAVARARFTPEAMARAYEALYTEIRAR